MAMGLQQVSCVARVAAAVAVAFVFSVCVALSLAALLLPLLFFAGYPGIMTGLTLAVAAAVGLMAFTVPALCRRWLGSR